MNKGFTLIEVVLASVIFAMIGTMTLGAIVATDRARETIETSTKLQDIGTAGIYKIREDLSQAFHVEAPRPLTFFKGDDNFDQDRIDFTALSHTTSAANARESDQAEITYMIDADPENPQSQVLLRREVRYFDGQPNQDNDGEFVTLATNVVAFNLEYSDGQTFQPSWDIRSSEKLNRLPKAIRASLLLQDEKGREATFETVVELAMTESLSVVTPTPSPTSTPAPGRGP